MKRESTSVRLNQIMKDKSLRQIDVLNRAKPYCEQYGVKMNKSDLSQYCSGKTEPNQDKLFILGKALDVSESWLMGLDVPKERAESFSRRMVAYTDTFGLLENQIISNMKTLNTDGKKKLLDYSTVLSGNPEFAKDAAPVLNAAHERTDIKVTDEMKKHDDDIMMDPDEWK